MESPPTTEPHATEPPAQDAQPPAPAPDLGAELQTKVLNAPRVVRLAVAGHHFDFDVLRLNHVFPHNILVALAAHTKEFGLDGVPIVGVQLDLLAVRTAYAFYAHGTVIIPPTQETRDILALTCDYLGLSELTEQVAAACRALEEQAPPNGKEMFVPPSEAEGLPSGTPDILNIDTEPGPHGDETEGSEFIELRPAAPEPKEEAVPLVARASCQPTPEDRKILLDETALRAAFGSKEGGVLEAPVLDAIKADKSFQGVDVPYTLAQAPRGALPTEWVESIEEFEMNLWALSYGVLGPDMPSALVLAGGAALRCLVRTPPAPPPVIKIFKQYLSFAVDATEADLAKAFSAAAPRQNNDRTRLTIPQAECLGRLLATHGHSFWPERGWRAPPSNPRLDEYLKGLRQKKAHQGDIDLFLVSTDPGEIDRAIRHVHARMTAVHGNVAIVRTENAVTFVPQSRLAPHVQIVLRAYKSLGQVLLGFDVDSCCAGYDGFRAVCTARFLRAVQRGYNLVDVTRLSPTYEVRLVKYLRRGFHIAMTEPALEEHLRQLTAILGENKHLALFPALLGITRLAYLLVSEWKLLPRGTRLPRVFASDYTYHGLGQLVASMRDGTVATPFAMGTKLDNVLFGSKAVEPPWFRSGRYGRRRRWRAAGQDAESGGDDAEEEGKPSTLGPIRIRTTAVTAQGGEDGLFTGSFNPIQLAWYKGGVRLPDSIAVLTCRRPDPSGVRARRRGQAPDVVLEGEASDEDDAHRRGGEKDASDDGHGAPGSENSDSDSSSDDEV